MIELFLEAIQTLPAVPSDPIGGWGGLTLSGVCGLALFYVWKLLREREKDGRDDLKQMRLEQAEERKRWEAERAEFLERIEALSAQLRENARLLSADMAELAAQFGRLLRYMIQTNSSITAGTADRILRGDGGHDGKV